MLFGTSNPTRGTNYAYIAAASWEVNWFGLAMFKGVIKKFMCAINPIRQKHFKLSVYTSDRNISKEDFDNLVTEIVLRLEMKLNERGNLRWHVSGGEQITA